MNVRGALRGFGLALLGAACGAGCGAPADLEWRAGGDGNTGAPAHEATPGERCARAGETRCGAAGVETCELTDGSPVWGEPAACGDGAACVDGECRACVGGPGTFHDLTLEVDGETRHYYLHVPGDYRCERPWPMLVDFHGTATGEAPEESYGLEELTALADLERFIVVRPRSRSSDEGGVEVYRWDQNPGDLRANVGFTDALVGELVKRYRIDTKRMYAFGFSSGTNMAAQLLGELRWAFSGFGMVGGGMWDDPGLPDLSRSAPRLYTVTGYRDYMFEYLGQLGVALDAAGVPPGARWNREADTGHDLYGWHYEEMWGWLARGERPPPGRLSAPWRQEAFAFEESLLALARTPAGDTVATGSGGSFFKRDRETGAWRRTGGLSRAPSSYCTALCFLPSGAGIAVGGTHVARTDDGGARWSDGPGIPEFQGSYFGTSYLNAVTCSESGRLFGGGYWTGVESPDGGETWQGARMENEGYPAQVAAMASRSGTVISAGYYGYIGRSAAGAPFQQMSHPGVSQWFNGVAAGSTGNFWVVGERGEILHSSDDGLTWEKQIGPGREDLYAVDFHDDHTGLAVGLHGAALSTHDGGRSWVDVSTGLDRYLGAVSFLDAHTALVVGERGTALLLSL
jgi:photosystem II stability/assembly factor-like uncharacterized protein/predicted esterase